MIFLGPSGLGPNPADELTFLKSQGLNAAEIAFTHGVRMKDETAKEICLQNKALGFRLSVHAPYFINLASKEDIKVEKSRERIIQSLSKGELMGARYVVFHAGYFQDIQRNEVANKIAHQVGLLNDTIRDNGWKIRLAPELTGKSSQYGSMEELEYLMDKTGCFFTMDFAHLYARNQGKLDYTELFNKLSRWKELHCHFSGINFGPKGERNHIILEKDFFLPLARELKRFKGDATIISESPVTWEDSIKMKEWLKEV